MGWNQDSSAISDYSSESDGSTDMAYGDASSYSENEDMEVDADADEEEEGEEDEDLDWYYAVPIGRCRGIFTSLKDAFRHTRGYSRSMLKKFPTFEEAHEFLNQYGLRVDHGYNYEFLNQYGLRVDHGYNYADGTRLWFAYAMNSGGGDFPDPLHPSSLVAFCGGSALRNGEPDCDAVYACVFPHQRDWDVVEQVEGPWPTSNRAEYMAALAALQRANIEDKHKTKVLFIYSDSNLLVESMSKWVYKWRNNGWRTVNGTDVQNRDLLEKLMAAQGNRRVQWCRVKAHSGGRYWEAFWNEIAGAEARGVTRED